MKHISCECKCKFDGRKYNSNQKSNNDKCRCECKNPGKHFVCEKDYIWNPATRSCENGRNFRKQFRKYIFWGSNFESIFFEGAILKKYFFEKVFLREQFLKSNFLKKTNLENVFFEGAMLLYNELVWFSFILGTR